MATNYFTLFGLPASFALDDKALHRAYIALQQQFHPDRMIGKSNAERARAIQTSMDVNDGYDILKNPLKRAQHLLSLQGLKVNQDGKDAVRPEQELLIEMMEMREELEEAGDELSVAGLAKNISQALEQCSAQLELQCASEHWSDAAQSTIRLRYLGKALEEAFMKQHQLKSRA